MNWHHLIGIAAFPILTASIFLSFRKKEPAHSPSQSDFRRSDRTQPPFWKSASIPDPADFRLPSSHPDPLPGPHPDYPAIVSRFLTANDPPKLNAAIAGWFSADPRAARDWLASRSDLTAFQPAIAMISANISRAGDPELALLWTAALDPGPAKEQALFDIYAFAARTRRFDRERLLSAPLSPDQLNQLLSGAPDD